LKKGGGMLIFVAAYFFMIEIPGLGPISYPIAAAIAAAITATAALYMLILNIRKNRRNTPYNR
jgi:hypothetical protein